jgi:regulator of protease activity HflC (stomatin/prohibitin superfamily)
VVTESVGSKQSAITVAEGQKQSAILSAEGDRQAAILRAEGFSLALGQISAVARGVDPNTLLLQYLDALRDVASSPSTKVLVPMELTNLLAGVRDLAVGQLGALGTAVSDGAGVGNGSAAGA